MSGVMSPLPLYAFMVWSATTLRFIGTIKGHTAQLKFIQGVKYHNYTLHVSALFLCHRQVCVL
jgi:hypothetical protein